MFNKRDASTEHESRDNNQEQSFSSRPASPSPASGSARTEPAVIGPSIHIDGNLKGDEDLVIDGTVKGTVTLKNNSLTIGDKGKVTADIYAKTILVKGTMQGDLYASEKVSIGSSAKVKGNIASPRVSLEDGARYKGSIEMDPEAEVLKTAFKNTATPAVKAVPSSTSTGGSKETENVASKSGSAA